MAAPQGPLSRPGEGSAGPGGMRGFGGICPRPPRRSIDASSRGQPRPLRVGGSDPISVELPVFWSSSGERTRCPTGSAGAGFGVWAALGGRAGWETRQGMCGVAEGKGEEGILAPARHLWVCVGLEWFAGEMGCRVRAWKEEGELFQRSPRRSIVLSGFGSFP